jgi:hypothetical protein
VARLARVAKEGGRQAEPRRARRHG